MVDLGLMKICGRCHLSAWGGSRKAFLSTLSGKETRHVNHWPIQPAMRFLLNQAPKPLFAILIVSCAAGWKFLKWGSRRLRGAFQSFCDQIMISLTYTYIYIYIHIIIYIYIIIYHTPLCQWRITAKVFEGLTVRYRFHKAETAGFVGAWSLDEELWILLWITVSHAQHPIPNSQTSSALIYIALNLDKLYSNSLPPVGKNTTDYRYTAPVAWLHAAGESHRSFSPWRTCRHSTLSPVLLVKGFWPASSPWQSDNNPPCLLGV